MSRSLHPIPNRDRIPVLDVARGLAIFGILLVNMAHFSYPDLYLLMLGEDNFFSQQWHTWDHLTHDLLNILIQAKFITMFSFLFGFGMIVMMERAEAQHQKFVPLYVRRLLALFLFGTIHAFFIWDGDILTDYALLGFLLLFFRKRKPKTLIIWAVILFSVFTLLFAVQDAMSLLSPEMPLQEDGWKQQYVQEAKQAIEIYSTGSFMDVAGQRIHDRITYMSMNGMLSLNPLLYIFSNLPYFSMFLLGAAFAKLKVFHQPERHRRLLKRQWLSGVFIGVPLSVTGTLLDLDSLNLIGAPLLMFFYVTSLWHLHKRRTAQRLLALLSNVGRTSLSNYILQSVVCTLIFYNVGLGLYGSVYPFAGLVLSVAIFIGQLVISHVWLKYFRTGPLEWVWRFITYRKRHSFRVQSALTATEDRSAKLN